MTCQLQTHVIQCCPVVAIVYCSFVVGEPHAVDNPACQLDSQLPSSAFHPHPTPPHCNNIYTRSHGMPHRCGFSTLPRPPPEWPTVNSHPRIGYPRFPIVQDWAVTAYGWAPIGFPLGPPPDIHALPRCRAFPARTTDGLNGSVGGSWTRWLGARYSMPPRRLHTPPTPACRPTTTRWVLRHSLCHARRFGFPRQTSPVPGWPPTAPPVPPPPHLRTPIVFPDSAAILKRAHRHFATATTTPTVLTCPRYPRAFSTLYYLLANYLRCATHSSYATFVTAAPHAFVVHPGHAPPTHCDTPCPTHTVWLRFTFPHPTTYIMPLVPLHPPHHLRRPPFGSMITGVLFPTAVWVTLCSCFLPLTPRCDELTHTTVAPCPTHFSHTPHLVAVIRSLVQLWQIYPDGCRTDRTLHTVPHPHTLPHHTYIPSPDGQADSSTTHLHLHVADHHYNSATTFTTHGYPHAHR